MERRDFLKAGSLTALMLREPASYRPAPLKAMTVTEPKRELPVILETDVIVCGGGPAGIGAALSAARSGAKTTLIEVHGCLGGVWTASLLSNIIDHEGKPGIMKEIIDRLDATDAQYTAKKYDAERMKWTLEQLCWEAGVEVRLHTRVTAAYKGKNNTIDYIATESFSGREAWTANGVSPAHGNGELFERVIGPGRLRV